MTEAELIEQKREERKKLLDEIKRKRAAAAQSEGIIGAAEEGQYGDVGQGGPKGEFDDEINQDPENADPSRFSSENVEQAGKAGLEALAYFTPGSGDYLSARDSVRAAKAAQEAEGFVNKIKLYGLSFLAAAGAVPYASALIDAGGPAVKRMINKAIKEAERMGPKPQMALPGGGVLGIDDTIGNLNISKMAGGAGASARGKTISTQRQYVNKKLKEIYDKAPIDPKTKLPDLPARWFSSPKVKKEIYDSNPSMFPEWKDGIGSWNDLTDQFLAGTIIKVKGKNVYTGKDAVTNAKLPVAKSKAAYEEAEDNFLKIYTKNTKQKEGSVPVTDQTFKYLNFIRLSEGDKLFNNPNAFFKQYNLKDLDNVDSTLYKGFEKFKVLDDKRKILSKDPELKILLEKVFPEAKNVKGGVKFQIGHTFESSQVRKGRVSKTKKGKGGDPEEMYIDLNVINMGPQKELEKQARKLEEIFSNENLSPELRREAMVGLEAINTKLTGMGAQGQTVTQIGDNIQSGFILGSKDVKFSSKVSNMAEDRGIKLTDADYEILLKADNIINPPRPFKSGGLVGISHLVRPL